MAGRAPEPGSSPSICRPLFSIWRAAARLRPSGGLRRLCQSRPRDFRFQTNVLTWSGAQSLYSLPDPVDALWRMRQSGRAGGIIAVLENDEFHHVLLPWPVEIEMALRHAELTSYVEQSDRPRKYYVGRPPASGLPCRRPDRVPTAELEHRSQAPLGRNDREFFARHLHDVAERVQPHLEPRVRDSFEPLVDPRSSSYLLDNADFAAVCIYYLVTGVNPGTNFSEKTRICNSE